VQKQEREQRALLGAAEREPALAVVDLEWPEDPELHAAATDANSAPKPRQGRPLKRPLTGHLHRLKRRAVRLPVHRTRPSEHTETNMKSTPIPKLTLAAAALATSLVFTLSAFAATRPDPRKQVPGANSTSWGRGPSPQ